MSHAPSDPVSWHEEHLRYQALRFIFDRLGPNCGAVLTGPQLGVGLALSSGELIRVIAWLDQHGYVHSFGSRPDICLTRKAISYFERGPDHRKSLRE